VLKGDEMSGKPTKPEAQDKFKKALSSVLSASPKQIRDAIAQAKAERPSPHTRYKYDPEADRS